MRPPRHALKTLLAFAGLLAIAHGACAAEACTQRQELAAVLDQAGVTGAIVILDAQTGERLCSDPQRAQMAFLPASTFKIPNTLIALETGVADGPGFALPWKPLENPRQAYWPEVWAQDHTLATALPNSVVWFYQELARRVGEKRMQAFVDRFDYGNENISGGIDSFWLTGGLRTSAQQQVDFLERFYFGKLGVSANATAVVKELLALEKGPGYTLGGKTGWAGLGAGDAPQIGWLVGFVETETGIYLYATNLEIEDKSDAAKRLPITKAALRELKLI